MASETTQQSTAPAHGLELFERVIERGGRILRAEGDRSGARPGLLALTFDVGRILLTPSEEGLQVQGVADRDSLPEALGSLDEEDPWWRLLGQPLTAARAGGVEEGLGARGLGSLMVLKLRFREETEHPRVVTIEATGSAMRISLE
jgi:hypothetical protein